MQNLPTIDSKRKFVSLLVAATFLSFMVLGVRWGLEQGANRLTRSTENTPLEEERVPIASLLNSAGFDTELNAEEERLQEIMTKHAGYVIPEAKKYYTGDSLNFELVGQSGSIGDNTGLVRTISAVSLAHAAGLSGAYKQVDEAEVKEQAIHIIKGVTKSHKSNDGSEWGYSVQSMIPASQAGLAGWLLWDDLDETTQLELKRMVSSEATYTFNRQVDYYRNANGEVIREGNSASEEESWGARILSLAYALMPDHAHAKRWEESFATKSMAAFSVPNDIQNKEIINGYPVCRWIDGSNLEPNGDIVNHKIIHPGYMRTPHAMASIVHQRLSDQPLNQAHTYNLSVIYEALSKYYLESGGIHYPQGNDWGEDDHSVIFYAHDSTMRMIGMSGASKWENLKGELVRSKQTSMGSGQVYEEDDWVHKDLNVAEFDAASKFAEAWLLFLSKDTGTHSNPLTPTVAGACPSEQEVSANDTPSQPEVSSDPTPANNETSSSITPKEAVFTDVSGETATAANWAKKEGYMLGTSDNTFSPKRVITRGEVVTVLWRMAGKPTAPAHPFSDIDQTSDTGKAAAWAYSTGISYGTTTTTFEPAKGATRGQAIVMMWRAAGKPQAPPSPLQDVYGDVRSAVNWAYSEGITTGKTLTTYDPSAGMIRGQLVVMIYRQASI